jgi:hypothetical protein
VDPPEDHAVLWPFIISLTVQLWTYVVWVISAYFNIRNTLPKSGTFLQGHSVYVYGRRGLPGVKGNHSVS